MRTVGALCGSCLAVCLAAAGAPAAVWDRTDVSISDSPAISLTTPTERSIVRLPDGSLFAVWFERVAQNSSVIRGAMRSGTGPWVSQPRISLGDSLSRNPCLATAGPGDIHVVWEDRRNGNEEIYYRHRNQDGSWDDEERLTFHAAPSLTPVLDACPAGRLHVVWSEGEPGNAEIYHRYRDPAGPWSEPHRLTFHPGESEAPAVQVDPAGDVHIVWTDAVLSPAIGETVTGNTEIYHMILDGEGVPLTPPSRVSRSMGLSRDPTLTIDGGGGVHIFWSDNRDRSPSSNDIFPFAIWYRRWLPGLGLGHEKRFCFTGTDHLLPAAAAGPDGTVNVVWEDFSHGNSEIYFRQISPATGWDVTKTRLTQSVGPTRGPSLISDPAGELHLVLSDTGGPGQELSIRYRSGRVDRTTPVVLSRAAAAWRGDVLQVTWETSSEIDHLGFRLYAAADAFDEAVPLDTGWITGGPAYAVDLEPEAVAGRSCLKLVAVGRDGSAETVALIQISSARAAPGPRSGLGSPFPNPSLGALAIPVHITSGGWAVVSVIDVLGRQVSRLDLGPLAPGQFDAWWDGATDHGDAAAPGRYWARLFVDGRPRGSPVSLTLLR